MNKTGTAGNKEESVRSDCFVSLTLTDRGGMNIRLTSKVKSMYGEDIHALCLEILHFYGIRNARVEMNDRGALPFTLAARMEAAIRQVVKTDKEFLLPVNDRNIYETPRDADRISRLYLPGNNPKLMINAGIYKSHGIILDLEDSVAPDKKAEARILVRNALRSVDFYGAERMVRINPIPLGLEDLKLVVSQPVNLILIPKCESAKQVQQVDRIISNMLGNVNRTIHLMPIVESASGVMAAFDIARASENVVAMAIGLEDYTADLGVVRTRVGKESFYARSQVVNAAHAAGIQPIDSVLSDVDDLDALADAVRESKALGFSGMGCIHPRQIAVINNGFMPDKEEIRKAGRIVMAYEKATEEGIGVVALESKMIDAPVVQKAQHIIRQAMHANLIPENWRETYG